MAPLSVFACYAYKNGGCRLSEDACRFPHAISDPSSQYLQRRRKLSQLATDETELIGILDRDLAPEDVPIAEAAAKAGFDCSNWLKLKGLINAVRAVKAPVTYPDRWNGKPHSLKIISLLGTFFDWRHSRGAWPSFKTLFALKYKLTPRRA